MLAVYQPQRMTDISELAYALASQPHMRPCQQHCNHGSGFKEQLLAELSQIDTLQNSRG